MSLQVGPTPGKAICQFARLKETRAALDINCIRVHDVKAGRQINVVRLDVFSLYRRAQEG